MTLTNPLNLDYTKNFVLLDVLDTLVMNNHPYNTYNTYLINMLKTNKDTSNFFLFTENTVENSRQNQFPPPIKIESVKNYLKTKGIQIKGVITPFDGVDEMFTNETGKKQSHIPGDYYNQQILKYNNAYLNNNNQSLIDALKKEETIFTIFKQQNYISLKVDMFRKLVMYILKNKPYTETETETKNPTFIFFDDTVAQLFSVGLFGLAMSDNINLFIQNTVNITETDVKKSFLPLTSYNFNFRTKNFLDPFNFYHRLNSNSLNNSEINENSFEKLQINMSDLLNNNNLSKNYLQSNDNLKLIFNYNKYNINLKNLFYVLLEQFFNNKIINNKVFSSSIKKNLFYSSNNLFNNKIIGNLNKVKDFDEFETKYNIYIEKLKELHSKGVIINDNYDNYIYKFGITQFLKELENKPANQTIIEELARKAAEEVARKAAAEEVARKAAEEVARKAAEVEAARLEEVKKKAKEINAKILNGKFDNLTNDQVNALTNAQVHALTKIKIEQINYSIIQKIWNKLTNDQIHFLTDNQIIAIINYSEITDKQIEELLEKLSQQQYNTLDIEKINTLNDKGKHKKKKVNELLEKALEKAAAEKAARSEIFIGFQTSNNNNRISKLTNNTIKNLEPDQLKKLIDLDKLKLLNYYQVDYIKEQLENTNILSDEQRIKIEERLQEILQNNQKIANSVDDKINLSDLTDEQIQKISPDKISKFTETQINTLKKWGLEEKDGSIKFKLLSEEQIQAINERYILNFLLMKPKDPLKPLNIDTFIYILLKHITKEQIESIPADKIEIFNVKESIINSNRWAVLMAYNKIQYLKKEQINKITDEILLQICDKLTNEQITSLDIKKLEHLYKKKPDILIKLTDDDINKIKNADMKMKIKELKAKKTPTPSATVNTTVTAAGTPAATVNTTVTAPAPAPAAPKTPGTPRIITIHKKTVKITKTSLDKEPLTYIAEIINDHTGGGKIKLKQTKKK